VLYQVNTNNKQPLELDINNPVPEGETWELVEHLQQKLSASTLKTDISRIE